MVAAAAPTQRLGEELQAAQRLIALGLSGVDLLAQGMEYGLPLAAEGFELLVR